MLYISLPCISDRAAFWSCDRRLGSSLQSLAWMLAHVEESLAISATQSFMWGGFSEWLESVVKKTVKWAAPVEEFGRPGKNTYNSSNQLGVSKHNFCLSAERADSSDFIFTSASKEQCTLFYRKISINMHTNLLYFVVFYPSSRKQEPNPRVLFRRESCVASQDP